MCVCVCVCVCVSCSKSPSPVAHSHTQLCVFVRVCDAIITILSQDKLQAAKQELEELKLALRERNKVKFTYWQCWCADTESF